MATDEIRFLIGITKHSISEKVQDPTSIGEASKPLVQGNRFNHSYDSKLPLSVIAPPPYSLCIVFLSLGIVTDQFTFGHEDHRDVTLGGYRSLWHS